MKDLVKETETDCGVDLGPGGQDRGVDSGATEPDHGVDPEIVAEQDRGVNLEVGRPEHEADLETIVRDRGANQVTVTDHGAHGSGLTGV